VFQRDLKPILRIIHGVEHHTPGAAFVQHQSPSIWLHLSESGRSGAKVGSSTGKEDASRMC